MPSLMLKVVAHRGASTVAPENTLAAFRKAVLLGAHAIEFDVQPTADGELVVIHDVMVDRTTNGRGAVFRTNSADLEGLDAGSWFSPEYTGERIPKLADVLALSSVEFELELKGYGEKFVDDVLRAVAVAEVLHRVEFTSSNLPLLALLKSKAPSARTGLFSGRQQDWMNDDAFEHHVIGMAETSGADVVHVYAGNVTPRIVGRLRALGLDVHANDAVSAEEIYRAVDSRVDRLSANDVSTAVEIARGRE